MDIIYIVLLILIAAPLLYLAMIDGNYSVQRSRTINCDIDTAYDKLRDLRSWPEWSPWLMHEPDTMMNYSDNCDAAGGHYSWDGKYIGAGKMTHTELQRPDRLRQKLEFIRPFKSVCEVGFDLTPVEDGTTVTWHMHGHMPFLLRFMIKQMVMMIGKDYELGLAMLNGRLDPDAQYPAITFNGESTLEPEQCLCKGFAGLLDDMVNAMQSGFPELMTHIGENNGQITGSPRSVYHKVNIKKMYFECDMAVPVADGIFAGEYQIKLIEGGKYFRTTLQGNYEFLELAWYSAYAHLQMMKFKVDKTRPSMEIYENDPESCASSNEWLTGIYIPVK